MYGNGGLPPLGGGLIGGGLVATGFEALGITVLAIALTISGLLVLRAGLVRRAAGAPA